MFAELQVLGPAEGKGLRQSFQKIEAIPSPRGWRNNPQMRTNVMLLSGTVRMTQGLYQIALMYLRRPLATRPAGT